MRKPETWTNREYWVAVGLLRFLQASGISLMLYGLIGCSVDAESLQGRAPVKGPGTFDAGTLDTTPSRFDSLAAEAPRAVPDAVPGVDGSPSPADTGTAPDLRVADVLPAPDLAPACPYITWTAPSSASGRWSFTVNAPATEICFTACGTMAYLGLSQPSARVRINGVSTAPTWNENVGYMPGTAAAIDGLYVFRVTAGDPVTISVGGWPNNATGACP